MHPLILVAEFKSEHGIDLSTDKMAMTRMNEVLPKVERELAGADATEVDLPFITADASGPKHLKRTVTRAELLESDRGDGFARDTE